MQYNSLSNQFSEQKSKILKKKNHTYNIFRTKMPLQTTIHTVIYKLYMGDTFIKKMFYKKLLIFNERSFSKAFSTSLK